MLPKKMNRKQLSYSEHKADTAIRQIRLRAFLGLMALFILIPLAFAAANPGEDTFYDAAKAGGTGIALSSMAVIGNIEQVNERNKAGKQIGYRVYLIARDQIDTTVPFPTPNANREVGSITLKEGEIAHYFEAIDDTIKDNTNAEKGEISTDITNTFTFIMGGNPVKLMNFLEEYAGRGFVIIYRECDTNDRYILGTMCKPMILKSFTRANDGDSKSVTLNFESKSFTQPLKYVGNLVTVDAEVVDAGAETLAITDNPQYRLSAHSSQVTISAVSGIAPADYGRVVDVLGIATGSNPPKIADNTVFILIDGAEWTANKGSKISFRILDDSTLVEVEGTRVQT
jgi:hypothetical protein